MQLDKYVIVRTEMKQEVGLLIGNGEMGGLGRNDGLGIDQLWFADYWNDQFGRAPIVGFRLSAPGLKSLLQKPDSYKQSLSLKDGILITSLCSSTGGFESRLFFCSQRPHVMAMQLRNTGKSAVEWILQFSVNAVSVEVDEKAQNVISFVYEAKSERTEKNCFAHPTTGRSEFCAKLMALCWTRSNDLFFGIWKLIQYLRGNENG